MSDSTLDNEEFDAVVLGTGLIESIVASELAAAGKKVLHIDRNPYYGGSFACFTLSAFIEWAVKYREQRQTPAVDIFVGSVDVESPTFVIGHASELEPAALVPSNGKLAGISSAIDSDITARTIERLSPYSINAQSAPERSIIAGQLAKLLENDRKYAIELAPKVAYCRGQLIDLVINAGIGEYVQFKGVEHNYIARNDVVERVPDSKGDVFASESLNLIEKRKLMRLMTSIADDEGLAGDCAEVNFAQFLATKFKLAGKLLDSVLYAVARAEKRDELSARAGCERVRKYVQSIGRYGRMAFLCAMYGGGSEIAQSFCRLCAVSGGTYILSEDVRSIEKRDGDETGFSVQLAHGK
ncbi:hypothetical protein GGI00_004012, partial [Coemansia sp. RSA 2681]